METIISSNGGLGRDLRIGRDEFYCCSRENSKAMGFSRLNCGWPRLIKIKVNGQYGGYMDKEMNKAGMSYN